jgi:hypothetical protein
MLLIAGRRTQGPLLSYVAVGTATVERLESMQARGWTGWLAGAGVVTTAVLLGVSGADATPSVATRRAPASASSASKDVTPIIECSVAEHGSTRTLYGYRNPGPTTSVAVGPSNTFSPGAASRGQPTRFVSGTQINVFEVQNADRVVWKLGTQQVQGPGPACKTSPAGSTLAGWGPIAALVGVTAFLGSLLFWRTRRMRVRTT